LDHNFVSPWLPLDCTTADCGGGYWQWMFIQAQVEDYGADFVTGFYNRYAPIYPSFPKAAWLLEHEIQAQSGGAESLSTRFAAYASDLWQPSRSTTGSVATLHAQGWPPASISYSLGNNPGFDTGWKSVSVDHRGAHPSPARPTSRCCRRSVRRPT
jgi:hypothetical protein